MASLVIPTFAKKRRNINILVRMDNVLARTYMNYCGETHSWPMNHLAMPIWKWYIDHHIFITAEHLLGVINQVADEESRTVREWCD